MTILQSVVDVRSTDFAANVAHMESLVDDLRAQTMRIVEGGTASARKRHTSRGKLLPRDRVQALLDPGSPFFMA